MPAEMRVTDEGISSFRDEKDEIFIINVDREAGGPGVQVFFKLSG